MCVNFRGLDKLRKFKTFQKIALIYGIASRADCKLTKMAGDTLEKRKRPVRSAW